jgi:hypothetical protein
MCILLGFIYENIITMHGLMNVKKCFFIAFVGWCCVRLQGAISVQVDDEVIRKRKFLNFICRLQGFSSVYFRPIRATFQYTSRTNLFTPKDELGKTVQ